MRALAPEKACLWKRFALAIESYGHMPGAEKSQQTILCVLEVEVESGWLEESTAEHDVRLVPCILIRYGSLMIRSAVADNLQDAGTAKDRPHLPALCAFVCSHHADAMCDGVHGVNTNRKG